MGAFDVVRKAMTTVTGQGTGNSRAGETGANGKVGDFAKQSKDLEETSKSPEATRKEMDKIAADGRKDAIQAAQLAAQAARTEAMAKNLKKGADAAKNLT